MYTFFGTERMDGSGQKTRVEEASVPFIFRGPPAHETPMWKRPANAVIVECRVTPGEDMLASATYPASGVDEVPREQPWRGAHLATIEKCPIGIRRYAKQGGMT
jgi:hypothetical protein